MKFVALLSGGKDSCFNIIKCIENKHELVALANLMPPDSDVEEMNSFMYQSAAHNTIPQMADCFGVPLYRQEIRGSAVVQSLDYKKEETDEVEDLFLLLQKVVDAHPGIRGVACGAIISNYQRLRVEDVCSRLGLTPLTYLWMRDRKELLDDIIETGVVAVLVKVAGAGLDPHKHLGKTLKEMRPILHRLHDRFGLDYCGEGGEYETLVLDCSAFKKKLILLETIILLDAEDCSVGNLKILRCSVEEKVPVSGVIVPQDSEDLEPNIQLQEDNCKLTSSLRHILELSSALNTNISNQQKMACNTVCGSHCDPGSYFTVSLPEQVPVPTCPNGAQSDGSSDNDYGYRNNSNSDCSIDDVSDGSLFTGQSTCNGRSDFQCLHGKDGVGQTSLKRSIVRTASALLSSTHPTSKNELSRGTTEAVAQMRLIMLQLKEAIVSSSECDIKDACFIHLYISDISLFHAVNDEYCTWFDRNPPSRSCVAVPLPPGIFVAADAVFLKGSYRTIQLGRSSRRQVLHVRSISAWAPLCIGPYAQGNVLTSSLVYVAGQIPLDPSSMLVLDKDIPKSLITSVVGCDDTALSEPLGEKKEIETTHGGQSDVVVSISPDPAVTEFPSALMDTLSVHLALSLRHAARVLGPLNSSLDRSLGCTVYLNMGVLEAEYGDIIRSAEINIWGEVALLAERLLTDNCDEPFPGKDSSLLRRVNADGDEDSDQESEEGITQTAQCRPPPVLVIGVSGIPRDCLLEAEVLSFTELLPKSDFTSSINTYLMQLTSNTQKSASLVVCDDDMSANKSARPSNSCLELLDDLNPDKWPVWYRAQAIHEDFRAENCDSSVAPGTDMYSHEERTSASRSSDSNCKRAVYAIVDVSPTLLEPYTDGSSGSGSSVIFSNPHSSPHGILVSTVRATECSRCVCSGFADVSLRSAESSSSKKEFASLVEENFTFEKFDNDLTMAGNGGKCKEGDNGVLDRAIDLLFLSIFQQMKKAALGVTDLRTLRVYYDPSSRGAVLGNVESAGVERECIRSTVVSYGEVEVSCIRAAEAIFGVQGNAFPLLILPVAQLSVVTSPLPLQLAAFSNGIPIVSANFLFIDLRQIKSETWINGH